MSIYLSIYLSIYSFVYLFIHLFIYLFIDVFIYLYIYFIISIFSNFTKLGALSPNYKIYSREELCNDFIQNSIYRPRMEMLMAMRDGFNIVGISNHLMYFSTKDFEKYFVGLEIYTANDVINNLKFVCDNDHEIIQFEFKNVIEGAILKLGENHGKLIEFVKFISGSTILQPTNKLIITPIIYGYGEVPFWPEYPLPKAQTCFNKLFAPYILSDSSVVSTETNNENHKKDISENDNNKNDDDNENRMDIEIINELKSKNAIEMESSIENVNRMDTANNENNRNKNYENKNKNVSVWNVDNVLKSFENILFFNKEAFSDN